ncbi:sensor histidine kinase [Lentibacillus saliphilus]|uniref:sensor histidine kinase n=1 Tax=Lentibacillus saliphilus TaxID=2737028 RepID=UPI001C30BE7D|nr:GHKL domain-containing protein [Lentibacillus saliphilus]
MEWSSIPFIHSSILFATSLILGLSLVGASLRYEIKKILILSVFASVAFEAFIVMDVDFLVPIIYVGLIPFIIYFLKLPSLQGITAVMLGVTYHFAFVELLEYNLFDLIVSTSHVEYDVVIRFVMTLFVMMNNILVAITVFQNNPVLLRRDLFYPQDDKDEQIGTHKPQLMFSIVILLTMNVFLYYINVERAYFTTDFRIFVIFWSWFMCGLILFFLRMILVHKLEQAQIYMDKQYQKDMLSFFELIRSQRHDFNFHLNSIYGLIARKEYDACIEYIDEVVISAQHINELLPLKHPAVSAMLNTQSEAAESKGITIHFRILDDLKDMPCSVYDMNKILGNLIQNAIDEVDEHIKDNRQIEVEITQERGQLSIKVTNPTTLQADQLDQLFLSGYSTKASHEGIGLAGIEKIVSRYKGIIFPEIYGQAITMHVRLPLAERTSSRWKG